MMKKIVFLFAMMLMSVSGFAQQAKEILDSYRGNEKVQVFDADETTMEMFMKDVAKTEAEREVWKNAEAITVLFVFDNQEMVDDVFNKFSALSKNGYERGSETPNNDDGVVRNLQTYYKVDNDIVREMLVLASAQGSMFVSYITGKFSMEQLAAISKNK